MYNNAIYIVNDSPTITEAIVELLKLKGFENISTFKNVLIDLSAKEMSYKRKALIADDDTNILNALKFFIEEEGYNVITAADGDEAIDAFKREKPQITFLNYKIPKKNA